MCEVINFSNGKGNIVEKKQERFEKLKIKNFNQNLTDSEEIEFDEVQQWLIIHSV